MSESFRLYVIAVVASAATLVAVFLLGLVLPFKPFLLFAIPVALTARYTGRGPTVFAVVLSLIAISVSLFGSGTEALRTGRQLWFHALIFAVVAFTINATTEALRKARREAERSAARLDDVNAKLEDQMEEVQMLSEHLYSTNLSLEAALDKAEQATRAREDVLGVVAHDLRNPLHLLMITTEMLADTGLSREKRDQLIGVMHRSARRMNRLIDDLLEIVRQEAGQMKLEMENVAAATIMAHAAEMFQNVASDKAVSLRVEECPSDVVVKADAERVMQVLSNLMGNAVKFVGSGGSVVLKCEPRGGEVEFSVSDSGPGIAPEDLARLFEKFWQRRRSDKRGVGLGLAIAKGIVEAHGGRIWAESEVGVGSTFHFTLSRGIRDAEDSLVGAQSNKGGAEWT